MPQLTNICHAQLWNEEDIARAIMHAFCSARSGIRARGFGHQRWRGRGSTPTDADPATSSGVGVDPTTSGGMTFPKAGPALGLRVGSASGLDFFNFFYQFTEADVIRRPPPLTN